MLQPGITYEDMKRGPTFPSLPDVFDAMRGFAGLASDAEVDVLGFE